MAQPTDEMLEEERDETAEVLTVEIRNGVATEKVRTAMLLTHGSITLTNAEVINTETFANDNYPLFGFGEIISTPASLDTLGMTIGTADTGSIASVVATGSAQVIRNSLGIGYLPVYTYENTALLDELPGATDTIGHGATSGKIFFHYSNEIDGEPEFNLTNGAISTEESTRTYNIAGPINYDDKEASGLQIKYGVDPTLSVGVDGDITIPAIEYSIEAMSELLLTAYAETEKAFPRSPPMRVRKKDIRNITSNESSETPSVAPTATSAPTTTSEY